MSDHLVVLITTPDRAVAEQLARRLVEARLAACVNILGPITSVYTWQGQLEQAEEVQLICKTRRARFDELAEQVASLHPYEVPEVICLPIAAGLPAYLSWIDESTR